MKHNTPGIFMMLLLLVLPCARPVLAKTPPLIAVYEFKVHGNFGDRDFGNRDFGKIIADWMGDALVNTERFTLIERRLLDHLIEEQELQSSHLVDEAKRAAEAHRLYGVEAIVSGSVTQYEGTISISARLVDASTGKISKAATVHVKSKDAEILQGEIDRLAHKLAGIEPSTPEARPVPSKGEPASKPKSVAKPELDALAPEMVPISGGCFQMGSPTSERGRADDEHQHEVCPKDFKIGRYEVTQAQWRAVMGTNPSHNAGCDRCPVEQVFSWDEVQDYIAKLNARTGQHYRLPTEAEWEYAARAGTTTPFSTGNCIHTDQANYDGTVGYNNCRTGVAIGKTRPVGSYLPNPWGLYDMHGNVWEWTCSAYDDDYGGAEEQCASKNDAGSRALRGGSWLNKPPGVRSANRNGGAAGSRDAGLGFRLAQDSL